MIKSDFEMLYPGDSTFEKRSRILKAKKVTSVTLDYNSDFKKSICLDYGCSVGLMTEYFATKFEKVIGVDVDKNAISIASKRNSKSNLKYATIKDELIPYPDNYFDVVVFNQVYEHVGNPEKSLKEIYRVLKPKGVCYFGARNKLFPMDGHYKIPFIAYFPIKLSNFLVKYVLKKKYYDIKLYTYYELIKLVHKFNLIDYTVKVIENPKKYSLSNKLKLILPFSKAFYFLIPNYIWLLEKK